MAIINRPTGLYKSLLPQGHSDPTSVIYTISGDIPRLNETPFFVIQDGIRTQRKNAKLYDGDERRSVVGDLVYALSTHVESKTKSGQTKYKMGQVLEFDSVSGGTQIVPNYVGDTVITQHNLGRLDLDALGLESLNANEPATAVYNQIQQSILSLQSQYDDLISEIDMLNKSISEINRAISALDVVLSSNPNEDLGATREQLISRRDSMAVELTDKTESINPIPDQISTLRDQLNTLAVLIN